MFGAATLRLNRAAKAGRQRIGICRCHDTGIMLEFALVVVEFSREYVRALQNHMGSRGRAHIRF